MLPIRALAPRALCPALVLLGACLAWGCASMPGTGPARGEEVPSAPAPERTLRHEVHVSYATNFFHWLDNLAGSTGGKTRDAYVRTWARYHDILDPEERSLLRRWRAMRFRTGRPADIGVPRAPVAACLPPDPGPSRRHLMNVAAREADSLDELRAGLAPFLDEDETRTLEDAIALFDPPMRVIWEDAGYLEDFARALRERLEEAEPSELVARMERFYGSRFESAAPSRISLIALFAEDRGTHAEANGRHLLLEIRPSDRPRNQVQVVYHELAHDLYTRMPDASRDDWARWFLSRGSLGALAWNYQHEAIPTALGQGVAESRLAPAIWSPRATWYHRPPIDRLAKAVYPRIRGALFAGETMSESLVDEIVAATGEELAADAPLRAYLATAGFVGPPALRGSLVPLAESLNPYRILEISDDASGAELIDRHPCLPLVIVGARAEGFAGQPLSIAAYEERLDEIGAVAIPWMRESGAIALSILTRDAEAASQMARQLARWPRWPEEPVLLRR